MNEVVVERDTKTRILDAAEKLFGEKGFDATSLRDITKEAKVNLAAVNYHFHSKDSLIDAVIMRGAENVNRQRLEMLEAAGPNATIEQILEAFVGPVIEQDYEKYAPLMGRVLSAPDIMKRIFRKHMESLSKRFVEAAAIAFPDLSEEERAWRLHFVAGAMAHTITRAPVIREVFSMNLTDRKAITARLVRFGAAGFRAPGVK